MLYLQYRFSFYVTSSNYSTRVKQCHFTLLPLLQETLGGPMLLPARSLPLKGDLAPTQVY